MSPACGGRPAAGEAHYIALSWGGSIDGAGKYDPSDFLNDPLDESQWLARTDNCARSDPAATPAPLPTLAAGDFLNGWELGCQGKLSSGETFGVRGEFLLGAVKGCRVEEATAASARNDKIGWSNPDGDPMALRIAWTAQACSDAATVSILPTLSGYHIHVIALNTSCPNMNARTYAVTFLLAHPIDQTLIEGEKSEPGSGLLPEDTFGP